MLLEKNNLISKFLPFGVVFLASLFTVVIWYRSGTILYYADSTYPIGNSWEYVKSFFYGWDTNYSGGVVNATGISILPLFIFIGILESFGFGQVGAQAIFFFLVLCAMGSGIIVLLRYFVVKYNIREHPIAIILPSLFYIFNLYIALNGWRMLIFLYLFYALLPWLVLLFLKYLDSKEIKYAILLGIFSSSIASVALTNLSYLLVLIGIYGLIFILYFGKRKILDLAFLYFKVFLVWIPLNLWYLLPQFVSSADVVEKATSGGQISGSFSILHEISKKASFLNIFSLQGYHSLYESIGGPWFWWTSLYNDMPFRILPFVFPILLTIVILLRRKISSKGQILIFFSSVLVLSGMFFSKGSHVPMEKFFLYLLATFPVPFLTIRAAYEKIGIVVILGYTLFLFFFLSIIHTYYRRFVWYVSGTLLVVIFTLGFPIWSGLVFDSNNGIRPSAHVIIPHDYYEVADILKKNPEAFTLSLPLSKNTWISSRWNDGRDGYIGNDILRLLSSTPIISTDIGNSEVDLFNRFIEDDFEFDSVKLRNLMARQVKYVLVRKDINEEWLDVYQGEFLSPEYFIHSIENSGFFEKIYESENLVLYDFRNIELKRMVYISDTPPAVPKAGVRTEEERIHSFSDEDVRYGYSSSKTINPVKRKVHVSGVSGPFYLVMNSNYSASWILESKNKTGKQISLNEFSYYNSGYTNSWYLEPVLLCDSSITCLRREDGLYDIDFVIEYIPQRWTYLGLWVSGISFFVCIFYLGALYKRKKVDK